MRVETLRGAMAVDGLGTTLMHEHVFVLTPDVMQNYGHEWWWDKQDRGADAVRQLQGFKDAGVDSIVELTVVAWPATPRGCSGSTSRWTYKTALLPRWNYTHITDDALREHGVHEAQITARLVHNAALYFTGGQE